MKFRLKILTVSLFVLLVIICVYIFYRTTGEVSKSTISGEETDNEVELNMSETVVAIDSGHGGIDPGKIGVGGIYEKEINLAIAVKLKKLLEQSGITVIMTRSDDNGLYDENDTNKKAADMKKRCSIINECNAALAVSIHQNSYVSADSKGAQVFYYKASDDGKKLAGIIQKHMIKEVDISNRRDEKADTTYYMLRNTKVPTVIVECGFLSNPDEAGKLKSNSYQQKIAEAICSGIIEYLADNK